MSLTRSSLIALTLAGYAFAAPACSSNTEMAQFSSKKGPRTGDLRFSIDVGGGVIVDEIDYSVSNSDSIVSGSIDAPQPGSTISAEIGVPAGTGYTADLNAISTDGKYTCSGTSTSFDVIGGEETAVTVTLLCTNVTTGETLGEVVINATTEIATETCPVAGGYAVSPLQVGVGGSITLTSASADSSATFEWSSSGGVIATTADAKYTCTSAGPDTITLTVGSSEVESCADAHSIGVTCVAVETNTDAGGSDAGVDGSDAGVDGSDAGVDGSDAGVDGSDAGAGGSDAGVNGPDADAGGSDADANGPDADAGGTDAGAGGEVGAGGETSAGGETGAGGQTGSPCPECLQSACSGPIEARETQCAGGACDALLSCFEANPGCANTDPRTCYCGSTALTDCLGSFDASVASGPCRDQIAEGVGLAATAPPLQVAQQFLSPANPTGAIFQYQICLIRDCSGQCL